MKQSQYLLYKELLQINKVLTTQKNSQRTLRDIYQKNKTK